MNTPDLDAIRARVDAATSGVWSYNEPIDTLPSGVMEAVYIDDLSGHDLLFSGNVRCRDDGLLVAQCQEVADAVFIAHAREDVVALLDEVECLQNYVNNLDYP